MPAKSTRPNKRQRRRTGNSSKNYNNEDWEECSSFTDSLLLALHNTDIISLLRKVIFNENFDKVTEPLRRKFDGEITKLCSRVEELEQYSRRQSVRISGVPEHENENTDDLALDVGRQMGINLAPCDINRSHRVGRRNQTRPRDIIVKFVRHNDKYNFYWARFKLKHPLYINESLTTTRSNILYKSRCAKRQNLIVKTWTNDGRIFIETKSNRVVCINTVEDLDDILSGPRGPRSQNVPVNHQNSTNTSTATAPPGHQSDTPRQTRATVAATTRKYQLRQPAAKVNTSTGGTGYAFGTGQAKPVQA
jgi:hypothetical protein